MVKNIVGFSFQFDGGDIIMDTISIISLFDLGDLEAFVSTSAILDDPSKVLEDLRESHIEDGTWDNLKAQIYAQA